MFAQLESRIVAVGPHLIFARQGRVAGPPIVLVHGLGTSSRYMIPTAGRLADAFSVFAPDLPGFGYSSKPDRTLTLEELAEVLASWMTAVNLPSATMVGNSVGCQVIAHLAVRHPQLLDRAVLQGPTMDAADRSPSGQFRRFLADLPREKLPEYPLNAHDYWRSGIRRLWQTFRFALADRIEDRLPDLTMPVLIVRGFDDPIVSAPWARHLTSLLPNGRFVTTRGAHTPNFSQPDAFSDLVRSFLRSGIAGR